LQALRLCRRPAAVVTELGSGAQILMTSGDGIVGGDLVVGDDVMAQIGILLADDASAVVDGPNGPLFVRCYGPPWSLVVIGAVHIAQALAPMARLAGFAVTVIDPRRAFATAERFPGVRLIADWPDEAMAENPPDSHSALVTLTHDPKLDDPSLIAALRSSAFYVGALGSRRTHGLRQERLLAAGLAPADIARIAAPVGLDLGARAPGEIAVSILAEIVGARHGRHRS
jgi:xanthine dehydrogenase accessory factor